MNLFLLHLFTRAAAPRLQGARLGTLEWYSPILSVPFVAPSGDGSREYLVFVLESPGPFVFVSPHPPFGGARAPARFSALAGAHVSGVTAADDDRVVQIDTRRDTDAGSEACALRIHLYGPSGRAVLRRADTVLETIGHRRPDAEGRARDGSGASASLVNAGIDAVREAVTAANAQEVSPQSLVAGLDVALVESFREPSGSVDMDALLYFRDAAWSGRGTWCLRTSGRARDAVPSPCQQSIDTPPARQWGPFANAVAACAVVGREILSAAQQRMIERLSRPLTRRIATNKKLITNLQSDLEKAAGHDAVRREAENLAAHQSHIRAGLPFVEVDDIYEPDRRVRIELDPTESVQAQVEKRFRRATKLAKSKDHALRRLEAVQKEQEDLHSAVHILQNEPFAKAMALLETARERFGIDIEPTPGEKAAPTPAGKRSEPKKSYRRFEVGDQWFALVGRNNQENDEITFKHAGGEDLWFHAQGVPGSHVILKSRGGRGYPPASVIERTASIAAHYSRAKHSSLVPVIYTHRKYVRKFRGAAPGQVTCEREKLAIVPPQLPTGE